MIPKIRPTDTSRYPNHLRSLFEKILSDILPPDEFTHLSLEDDVSARTANRAHTAFLRLTRSEKGVVVAGLDEFIAGSMDLLCPNDGTKPFPERVT